MKAPIITAIVLLCSLGPCGCYRSSARTADADTNTSSDVILDTVHDTSTDTATDPEIPEPSCLYSFEGSRQLASPTDHATDAPHIYDNGTGIGVVIFESGGIIPHSYVSLVNSEYDLSTSSAPRLIGEESHGWGEPAWTGDKLGLCWYSDPGMVGRTAFRLLDRNGASLGSMVDLDWEGSACVAMAYGNERFLAAWRHQVWIDEEYWCDSRIQLLDAEGAPVAEPMDLHLGPYPGLAPMLMFIDGEFLIGQPNGDEITFRYMGVGGAINRTATVEAPGAVYCSMDERDGVFAVACVVGPERGERGVTLRLYDMDFAPIGNEIVLEPEGAGAAYPHIVAVKDGWALSYSRGGYPDDEWALLHHLTPEGLPREPRIVAYSGTNSGYGGPSITDAGNLLFVGISHTPDPDAPPGWEQVHLQRYRCIDGTYDVCAPQDVHLDEICDDGIDLGWRYNGAFCELVTACPEDCLGTDCVRLAPTEWDCVADRRHCV